MSESLEPLVTIPAGDFCTFLRNHYTDTLKCFTYLDVFRYLSKESKVTGEPICGDVHILDARLFEGYSEYKQSN